MKHTRVEEFSNRELMNLMGNRNNFKEHILKSSLSNMITTLELSEIEKIDFGLIMHIPDFITNHGDEYIIRHDYKCLKCSQEIVFTETIIDQSCKMTISEVIDNIEEGEKLKERLKPSNDEVISAIKRQLKDSGYESK